MLLCVVEKLLKKGLETGLWDVNHIFIISVQEEESKKEICVKRKQREKYE